MAPPGNSKYNSGFGIYRLARPGASCVNRINIYPGTNLPMPDYNDFLARIYDILRPFAKQGHILNEDSELVTELGLTSLQVMELIEQIEDHFDISVPLNILPDIRSAGDLARQLEKLTN